ncbi:chemotaxis response regulator protein-glutamate methylesterase [uncultured Thalassolituus sp.]|uniref:protein-glutamate methylesterase/protein-glutamine glutaminase n=1 Tax=uncultured Thalassolituus sp. TaxID=285273 RepID=UPI002627CD63|nr:chemotaxis response regulator protein-glutamate methylesterase [uncultured Thalassolituus sp.]
MILKVLVVDDSGFFRRRVTDIINADGRMEVVGVAEHGRQAIELNESLKPDVITMDYEMPVMDGITAVRHIMSSRPVPVLMFSSLTFEGARVTLDAIDAGAVDFLPKNFDAIARNSEQIRRLLTDKIEAVARSRQSPVPAKPAPRPATTSGTRLKGIELIVIGTSTGGPAALQTVFRSIPADFRVPIIIVQHMPASFTTAFAERLNNLSGLSVKEAADGDAIRPGCVYVAPGGMQLMVDRRAGGSIHIRESDERINYRPSVDIAFASAAKHYGGHSLGIVLTGMGADGKEGARLIKEAGGHIWTQDEATSVIYGMPMSVNRAGLSDAVLALSDVGPKLASDVR